MRQRSATSVILLKDENELPYAVHLEAGGCAEHEYGIKPIYELLEMPDDTVNGLERYQMAKTNTALKQMNNSLVLTTSRRKHSALNPETNKYEHKIGTIHRLYFEVGSPDKEIASSLYYDPRIGMTGSFSDQGFEVIAFTPEAKSFLKEMHKHMLAGDFAAHMGGAGGNPFARDGLNLSIPSRVPENQLSGVMEDHVNAKKLKNASDSTGIARRLAEAQIGYHALSPAYSNTIKVRVNYGEVVTNYPAIYFLNPQKQDLNNFGWFTVEELDAWIDGHGPIPKEPSNQPRP